ncbi:MAG: hypothetical protein MUF53_08810, partial [Gemmatimonadaceae bacterium]|nr:hypothetical protein [Gemmatimonadaceae bacterium]
MTGRATTRWLSAAWFVGAAAVAASPVVSPTAAQVPGGRCVMVFDNTPTTRLTSVMTPTRRYNSYIGGGVRGRCQG